MQKEIVDSFNQVKDKYVFCGMLKLRNGSGLYYVSSYNIYEDFDTEFEVTINSMDDFIPLNQWGPEDYVNAIDGELENQNYHSYEVTPRKVLSALPQSFTDAEKIEVLKTLYDWLSA